ncbi:hypothetical protein CJF30_00002395 [Rutstroemia sp. NJR-2017a BBW]|nr:hypothetical protein CJF30_00002395 [Rutstroemia sp. NJR-2017a BBW]
MPNNKSDEVPALATADSHKVMGWSSLSLELRLAIWGFLYFTTPARIVEVQTAEHDHSNHPYYLWCPRYSPSPAPLVVNVCREARDEARKLARLAGHLLFPGNSSHDIYFNPAIDTLYIPSKKERFMGSWTDELSLAPFKVGSKPEKLRSLALGLDTRATEWTTLRWEILELTGLEEVILVVERADQHALAWMKGWEKNLRDDTWGDRRTHENPRPEWQRLPMLHLPPFQQYRLATSLGC